ncbi:STAS-like domain-containing protein [bacterium]|nr:STAS-like domain-containing protein [bacterium]
MEKTKKVIKIKDIVGSNLCISSHDGERVYLEIAKALRKGFCIKLSFEDIEDLTSAFLNSAVGRLYNHEFEYETISENLTPENISPDKLRLLKRVVDRAKEFFEEPDRFDNAVQEVLGSNEND